MCDYSLMALPNRLAINGEELVIHRFDTGAKGFISSSDAEKCRNSNVQPNNFLAKLWWSINRPYVRCTAVCIPPGARLVVQNMPEELQQECGLKGQVHEAVFTQASTEFHFRDALRFLSGRELSLQKLNEGLRAQVVSVVGSAETIPEIHDSAPIISEWPVQTVRH